MPTKIKDFDPELKSGKVFRNVFFLNTKIKRVPINHILVLKNDRIQYIRS